MYSAIFLKERNKHMKNKVTSVISKKQVLEILKEFRSCSYLPFSEIDFIDAVKSAVEDLPESFISEGHWSKFNGANLIEYKENNGIE